MGLRLPGSIPAPRPRLSQARILRWADDFHSANGSWPTAQSGSLTDTPGVAGENWAALNYALKRGRRGLRGGTTLTQLLSRHRALDPQRNRPQAAARGSSPRTPLSVRQILAWADQHHRRTGQWPMIRSGRVLGQPEESWSKIHAALVLGYRSLPGGDSLSRLLVKHRGSYNKAHQPPLTIPLILEWADEYHRRTGRWPHSACGRVPVPGRNSWHSIDNALIFGMRGLPGGSSLRHLFVTQRGNRDLLNPPRLSYRVILDAADAHYRRTGERPHRFLRGRIPEIPLFTWSTVNQYMLLGKRGLRSRSSLARLLKKHRPHYFLTSDPLKRSEILDWAAQHHELTGALPTIHSGAVRDQPGETWHAIDAALRAGSRGLRGTSTLADFLHDRYAPRFKAAGAALTAARIISWAERFRENVGRWPTKSAAYIDPLRTEKWSVLDTALREGHRGLPGGSSLAKLLAEHRRAKARG